ncbi:olfactory receptor 6M1-like [Pelobates fuscus]|uniref:olfactory receptor 6M1-like n=1 Tax=Pelobates fuscus TaxID=191477 RepID=UPI002FE4F7F3
MIEMKHNVTVFSELIFIGFSLSREIRFCLFILIAIVYTATITSNFVIILIVTKERSLHKPMYFFIGGLSFLELWYPTVTVPTLLLVLFVPQKTISLTGCLCQYYFHFSLGATENFLLAIMAFDRYVAICNPLRYTVIMSPKFCVNLLLSSWIFSLMIIVIPCLQISNLVFCVNEIDHYYCDFAPLLKLSCVDVSTVENLFFAMCCFVILGCFLPIIVSYVFIIVTIIRFPTASGRRRAFSTCASHIIVVLIFYTTNIFMFIRPSAGDSLHVNKIVSIFPTVVTPLLNPIIYTLRNQEFKGAAKKTFQKLTMWGLGSASIGV